MRDTVIIVLLFLTAMVVHGQDTMTYTDVEKESFVSVFWELKGYPLVNDTVIQGILKDAGVSPDRYGELINSRIKGDKIELGDADLRALAAIRTTQDLYQQEKSSFEKSICARHGLAIDAYYEILQAYRTSIAFQQSIRPFFNAYMDKRKK